MTHFVSAGWKLTVTTTEEPTADSVRKETARTHYTQDVNSVQGNTLLCSITVLKSTRQKCVLYSVSLIYCMLCLLKLMDFIFISRMGQTLYTDSIRRMS